MTIVFAMATTNFQMKQKSESSGYIILPPPFRQTGGEMWYFPKFNLSIKNNSP